MKRQKKNKGDKMIRALEFKVKAKGITLPKVSNDVRHTEVYREYLRGYIAA